MKNKTKPEYGFIECSTCISKPGSPILCTSCLRNRDTISYFEHRLDDLKEMLINWRDSCIVRGTKYYSCIENEKGGHIRGFNASLTSVIDKIDDNNF